MLIVDGDENSILNGLCVFVLDQLIFMCVLFGSPSMGGSRV